MDFHKVIDPICSVFVAAPTLCVLTRISYFKSRDLNLSLTVIEDFLLQDLNYGTAYPHFKEDRFLEFFQKKLKDIYFTKLFLNL